MEREDIDIKFAGIYHHAVTLADKVGTEPSKPRIARRQQHRANAPSDSIEGHYKMNVAIPFIDHIGSQLDTRFSCKCQ